jgi:alpha(1,3/1,4) fucosyltransferase
MIFGNIYCENITGNKLFDYSSPRNSDGLFTPYILLRDALLRSGIEINTPDLNAGKTVSFEIHMDARPVAENGIRKYLIAVENPLINLLNADPEHLKSYHRVFSWNDASLIYPGAVRIFTPNVISMPPARPFAERAIFSCLISSNKVAPWFGSNDLYAERINVIRWYEKHALPLFRLYGRGWGKPSHVFSRRDKLVRRIARLRSQLFGYKPFPSWQGEVNFKSEILSNAKFSYCYENVSDMPYYITEKIFDSFFSGCVPIYWGADNVLDYIPADCFIDRRNFMDTAEVHQYLLSVTPEQHAKFQQNIAAFLNGEKGYLFSAENFATTIADTIAGDVIADAAS